MKLTKIVSGITAESRTVFFIVGKLTQEQKREFWRLLSTNSSIGASLMRRGENYGEFRYKEVIIEIFDNNTIGVRWVRDNAPRLLPRPIKDLNAVVNAVESAINSLT